MKKEEVFLMETLDEKVDRYDEVLNAIAHMLK